MIFTRNSALVATAALIVGLVPALAVTAGARAPRPVITSVEAKYGSSVGYAHLIIHGRHLTGGTVTVAGRATYAKVINSHIVAAFPAGHRHGHYKIVVRTKAGSSNRTSYEFRSVRPSRLRVTAASAAPGGKVADLAYTITRCPAAGTCVSIGSDYSSLGPVARVATAGRTVTQRIPVPADADGDGTPALSDLSCPTTTFCAAVGGYDADSVGLFSTWNGSTWTSRRMPAPVGDPYPIRTSSQVSCGGPSHCVALDNENVYTFDDGTLAVATAVAPPGYRNVRLHHVACPASGWCLLTGSGDVGTTRKNFVAIRSGVSWTSRPLADPPGWKGRFAADLPGLDCRYVDRCTVLAGGRDSAPIYFGALHAGAATWREVPLPADAHKASAWSIDFENTRLTCPSSSTCWTFAEYTVRGLSGKRGYQPVAVRLHAGKVRVDQLPRPASSRTGRFALNDLSCATPSSCEAVGSRGDRDVNNIHGDAIVETYAKGVWTPVAAPSPAGRPKYSGYEFTSIDCAGVARCTATGDYNYDHNPDAEGDEPLEKGRPVVLQVTPR